MLPSGRCSQGERQVKRSRLLTAFLALALLFSGCALIRSTDGRKAYAVARTTFNSLCDSYLKAYDEASPEVQAKWKKEIDPQIRRASLALDIWKLSIDTGDEAAQAAVVKKALDELQAALIKTGVVAVAKGVK